MEDDWESQPLEFAQRLEDMVTAVIGESDSPRTARPEGVMVRGRMKFIVRSANEEDIPLTVDGRVILRLAYTYQCFCRAEGAPMQVDVSSVTLRAESDPAPIVHYDYVRNVLGSIPAAHINIHASNDSATKAMLACGVKGQGRSRRKKFLERGAFPTFSALHFPVGGDRFRPCLEDVLQMACSEFGIDTVPGWQAALEQSRAEYRRRQIRAVVEEFPDLAYDVLVDAGYDLSQRPQRPDRAGRADNLIRY